MTARRTGSPRGRGAPAQSRRGIASAERGGAQAPRAPAAFLLAAAVAAAVVACGDGDDPAGPGVPPEERVATIEVTSPIDTVMVVGRSVRLEAVAREADGTAVSGVAFTWAASNQDVAAVDGTGLVQAAAPGTSSISAAAGAATGSLRMRVVDVDLDAIAALFTDPYALALVSGMGADARSRVQAAIADCASARDAGHVIAMGECLRQVAAEAATVAGGADRVLAAVLDLYADRGLRLLDS